MATPCNPLIHSLLKSPLDFTHLIDEIPLGILVLDSDCRVVHLNKAFEAMFCFIMVHILIAFCNILI